MIQNVACADVAEALERCRAEGLYNRYFGGCNLPKQNLILCLRKEVRCVHIRSSPHMLMLSIREWIALPSTSKKPGKPRSRRKTHGVGIQRANPMNLLLEPRTILYACSKCRSRHQLPRPGFRFLPCLPSSSRSLVISSRIPHPFIAHNPHHPAAFICKSISFIHSLLSKVEVIPATLFLLYTHGSCVINILYHLVLRRETNGVPLAIAFSC